MTETKIVVVGSSNTDMVLQSDHLPAPGETVLGGSFSMNAGGKGANQAVAAARLGGHVTFAARVGNDQFGRQAIADFEKEGIDTRYISVDDEKPSGVALILVDSKGENSIAVSLGANDNLSADHITPLLSELPPGTLVLVQLETPLETVNHLAAAARSHHLRLILNPAPADMLPETTLDGLFMITPNTIEAGMLSGISVHNEETAKTAAAKLRSQGVQNVVITLGGKGAYVASEDFNGIIDAFPAEVIDTTAAGDTFNGALAVALSEGKPLTEAVRFGNQAAAHAVGILGAQTSIPTRNELISKQ